MPLVAAVRHNRVAFFARHAAAVVHALVLRHAEGLPRECLNGERLSDELGAEAQDVHDTERRCFDLRQVPWHPIEVGGRSCRPWAAPF